MSPFRNRLAQLFYGRNGVDELGKFFSWIAVICMLSTLFIHNGIIYLIGVIALIYCYFRMMSRNIYKRQAENRWFCDHTFTIRNKMAWAKFHIQEYIRKTRNRNAQRNIYRFYTCPTCKQKVRVPKNRGRIAITCPKCQVSFIKNTGKKKV